MKELSIEQKAKAYDMALENAKHYHSEMGDDICCVLEECFPILKESEDERIRKNLIELFHDTVSNDEIFSDYGLDKTKVLAWLEKQGKSNPDSGVSFKYNGHTWGMCARDNGVEILIDRKIKERIFLDNKPQGKSALKAINEEKVDNQNCVEPIDNIEPKFHEGDWVVYNNEICQIVTREEGCNKLVTVFGIEKELVNERNLSTARLWNIQDAKEGDVLVTKYNQPFIYNGNYDLFNVGAYCGMDCLGEMFIESSTYCQWSSTKVKPATKEQRDTLMKAMADAGYTFDFEKKELKKVENEEYNGEDYGIDSLYHAQRILEETLGKVDGYQSDDGILEHKCAITAINKLYEKKSAWSEEDDAYKLFVISAIEDYYDKKNPLQKDLINWIKSLKYRIGE